MRRRECEQKKIYDDGLEHGKHGWLIVLAVLRLHTQVSIRTNSKHFVLPNRYARTFSRMSSTSFLTATSTMGVALSPCPAHILQRRIQFAN